VEEALDALEQRRQEEIQKLEEKFKEL